MGMSHSSVVGEIILFIEQSPLLRMILKSYLTVTNKGFCFTKKIPYNSAASPLLSLSIIIYQNNERWHDGRRGHSSMVKYLHGIQQVLNSISDISSNKDQVIGGVEDFYLKPWRAAGSLSRQYGTG